MATKKWTEEEEEFLRENYLKMTNAELAEKFGITKNAVQKKLARLELKRSEAVEKTDPDESDQEDTTVDAETALVGMESHFQAGNRLYFEECDYEGAIKEYGQAAKEETDEEIRLKAQYWMAESYVKLMQIESAIKAFRKLADEHGTHYLGASAERRIQALNYFVVPNN